MIVETSFAEIIIPPAARHAGAYRTSATVTGAFSTVTISETPFFPFVAEDLHLLGKYTFVTMDEEFVVRHDYKPHAAAW